MRYNAYMTVQTIPAIEDMTPAQRVELMEALWKEMGKNHAETKPPEWHLDALDEAERSVADGTDEFIELEEFESLLQEKIRQRNIG